jgi:hypothetical protein
MVEAWGCQWIAESQTDGLKIFDHPFSRLPARHDQA